MPEQIFKNEPVRIIVPTSVGYDLKQFKQCLTAVAAHLGHPNCASGLPDCHFNFRGPLLRVDEKLEVHNLAPQAQLAASGTRTVKVGLPKSVNNNLDSISKVVDQVARRIGCLGCTSGFDIMFQQELDTFSFQVTEEGSLA